MKILAATHLVGNTKSFIVYDEPEFKLANFAAEQDGISVRVIHYLPMPYVIYKIRAQDHGYQRMFMIENVGQSLTRPTKIRSNINFLPLPNCNTVGMFCSGRPENIVKNTKNGLYYGLTGVVQRFWESTFNAFEWQNKANIDLSKTAKALYSRFAYVPDKVWDFWENLSLEDLQNQSWLKHQMTDAGTIEDLMIGRGSEKRNWNVASEGVEVKLNEEKTEETRQVAKT